MALEGASHDVAQLPLNGVVMCCTSILAEQRSELASLAAQMGAVNKLDLTSDVTHLVVGNTDTPKYKYVAKERPDVRVLLPTWIHAVRERWISGADDLDLALLEHEYRVPTFFGLRVCVTGFEEQATRKQIEEIVINNGGEYKGDLSKDITHLIAAAPEGQKYRYAKRWNIKIITLQWFQQSLERGMVLEETLFDPLLDPSEQGKGAWTRRAISATNLGKRPRDDYESVSAGGQGRKLRRSASSRFDSQNDGIWTDIVAPRPYTTNAETISKWEEGDRGVNESVLEYKQPTATTSIINPFKDIPRMPAEPQGILSGYTVLLYGFDKKKSSILEQHISSHNGRTTTVPMNLQNFSLPPKSLILFPYDLHPSKIPEGLKKYAKYFVTYLWLEKCLHEKRLVDIDSCPMYRPFLFPVPDCENLIISSTAFEDIDLPHLGKTVKLIGAAYDEFLTRKTSILVCNHSSMSREKIKHALEWSIPAVNSDWLWDSIKTNSIKDLKPYLVYPAAQQHLQLAPALGAAQEDAGNPRASSNREGEEDQYQNRQEESLERNNRQREMPFFEDDDPEYIMANDDSIPQDTEQNVVPEPEKVDTASLQETDIAKPEDHLHDLVAKPLPLQERSPNSPTKPQSSTQKVKSDKGLVNQQAQDRELLSDTLHTILSRQKSSGSGNTLGRSSSSGSVRGSGHRKDKRLLGRATSNLSARSAMAGGPPTLRTAHSRASSIDTLNTNGLGTPIEGLAPLPLPGSLAKGSAPDQQGLTTAALSLHDELFTPDNDEAEITTETLQMTQVRYEDPEAGRWRAKLLQKITAGKGQTSTAADNEVNNDLTTTQDVSRVMLLEDDPSISRISLGAGRRTRKQRGI